MSTHRLVSHTTPLVIPQEELSHQVSQPWQDLPIRVTSRDVITIDIPHEEWSEIRSYAESVFPRIRMNQYVSQWKESHDKNRVNPNEIGIRGEWAGMKYFEPETCMLWEFLEQRPSFMSDMGDVIITGESKSLIFDYKTASRSVSIQDMVDNELYADSFMAKMDGKFINLRQRTIATQHGYLQAFIFCVNHEGARQIHLMGWITAEEYFKHVQYIRAGESVPQSSRPYSQDVVLVPYRRLRPMYELRELAYQPITLDRTQRMRSRWGTTHAFNVQEFI